MTLLSYFHSFLFLNRRFLFRKDKSYLERKKSCRVAFLVEQGNHIRVEEGEEEAGLATPSWTKRDAVQPYVVSLLDLVSYIKLDMEYINQIHNKEDFSFPIGFYLLFGTAKRVYFLLYIEAQPPHIFIISPTHKHKPSSAEFILHPSKKS